MKAFIDAGISTDETANKFKRRREKAIEKCERRVPYNFHTFIGEAFQKAGAEVLYSVEDNDDTLATYAHEHNALIMSNDKDYFRYEPKVPGVISDHQIYKGKIHFIYKEQPNWDKMPPPRKLIKPLP